MTLSEAVEVLSAAHHRGVRLWYFDGALLRVLPGEWNGLYEVPPAFTAFEALAIARGLARIGAVSLPSSRREFALGPDHHQQRP